MALRDIIVRIEADTRTEVAAIIAEAEAKGEQLHHEAVERSEREGSLLEERAHSEAVEEGRVRVASARLKGRDRILAEKRVIIGRAMAEAEKRVHSLSDEEYSALIAREVAATSRGGETLLVGVEDEERLRPHIEAALKDAGASVTVGATTDETTHGVLVMGERMRVEVSVRAILKSQSEELESVASETLFGAEE